MAYNTKKRFIKEYVAGNYYKYHIFEIDAGMLKWLEADPITPGVVTRCADCEEELRILLENDATNANRFKIKVR